MASRRHIWPPASTAIATNLANGAANEVPYQSGANATAFVAAANSSLLYTSGAGVPTLGTAPPLAATALQQVTLGAGATAIAITSSVVEVTGDAGGNTVATITGGKSGQLLTLIFVDALVTLSDDNTHAANTLDLNAASIVSADDKVVQLVFDGTSWYHVSTSTN